MRSPHLLVASAVLLTVSTLAVPALARDRDRQDRGEITATQLVNEADAATARMKADLHITAAQQKDWDSFEAARHDMSQRHAERAVAMQAADRAARDADRTARDAPRSADGGAVANPPATDTTTDGRRTDGNATVGKTAATDATTAPAAPNLIDRINSNADAQIARANDWKKLAEAARPLYASFDGQQKRYFAELLFGGKGDGMRERDER